MRRRTRQMITLVHIAALGFIGYRLYRLDKGLLAAFIVLVIALIADGLCKEKEEATPTFTIEPVDEANLTIALQTARAIRADAYREMQERKNDKKAR